VPKNCIPHFRTHITIRLCMK
jgi:hypothetical protein